MAPRPLADVGCASGLVSEGLGQVGLCWGGLPPGAPLVGLSVELCCQVVELVRGVPAWW